MPPKDKRVLAWVSNSQYPFVGYFSDGIYDDAPPEGAWYMEVECLNGDTYRNDIFGDVVAWQEIPARPTMREPDIK
jgi:hypothetical protein